MSQQRDELIALRKRLMMGDPPYEIEPVLGRKVRKTGTPGFHELQEIGNYGAGASGTVLTMDAIIQILDHLLGRVK
jgi:hypothetical protein